MNANTRTLRRLGLGFLGALLLLTACNGGQRGDGGGGPGRNELSASELKSPLNGAYKIKPNGSRVPPRENELPVRIGTVVAHWYRSNGMYVIAFKGLDLQETGPLCPGSSVQTDAGFEHVTNAPTRGNACEGAENLASPTDGVRNCGPLVLYITEIPEDAKGDLVATIERYEGKGIIGVTGVVDANMSKAPEIDTEAEKFTLPEGLVEGTKQVTC